MEEIKQPLRYAMIAAGLHAKNFPADEEKGVLVNFIQRNYADYSPAEIGFAFDKAMARRFPSLDNPSCFENFSCEYIGRVLSAYEQWNSEVSIAMMNSYRESAQSWYEKHQAGEHIDFIPGAVYWILNKDGFIRPIHEKREYPKFLKVIAFFAHAASKGCPCLYINEPVGLFLSPPAKVDRSWRSEPSENPDDLDF